MDYIQFGGMNDMKRSRVSLFVVILAIMGLLITPTIVSAEEEHHDGDDMTDPVGGSDDSNGGWDVVIEEFYIIEMRNIFKRGETCHIFWKVTNKGSETAPDVELHWSEKRHFNISEEDDDIAGAIPLPSDDGSGSGGGDLDPGESWGDIKPYYCTELGFWDITLTVTVQGAEVDSETTTIVVIPNTSD